jgi:hypothetical protein
LQVGDAFAVAGLAADPQPVEQLAVDQHVFVDLVDRYTGDLSRWGLLGVR